MADKQPEDAEWQASGEVQGPSAAAGAVQAIEFSTSDLRSIRAAAQRSGLTTSEFVRLAAVSLAASGGSAAGVAIREPGRRSI